MSADGWLSPHTLVAVLLTVWFAAFVLLRPSRAVLAYAVLGATPPALQLGGFSGRTSSQGLLLAEVLATLLVGVWLTRRDTRARLLQTPFDLPLVLVGAAAILSLVAAEVLPDLGVADHVTRAVSVGQVLLVLWPIGTYFASRELLAGTSQIAWLQRATILMAVPQVAMPFLPGGVREYMSWVWTFGLYASPLAFAAAQSCRSLPLRLVYLAITFIPFGRGVTTGKVFLYSFVLVSVATILWVRAARAAVIGGGMVVAVALAGVVMTGPDWMTAPIADLVAVEQSQFSYGGQAGRGQLILDALSIWREAPFLGVGPGNSYVYMLQRSPIGTPHNQYMNILAEFGLVGLSVWIWFLVAAFRTGLRIYRQLTHPVHRTFALGWLGAFAGMVVGGGTGDFMLHSIRNNGLELFQAFYLQWILLGGLVATARFERQARAIPATGRAAAPSRWAGRVWARPPRFREARRITPAARA